MSPSSTVSPEEVKDARKAVYNQFGTEMASKASDAFCLAFGREAPRTGFVGFAEGGRRAEVPPARPLIVEFTPAQQTLDEVRSAAEEVRAAPAWSRLEKSLQEVQASTLRLDAERLLRQSKIETVREDFYKMAGLVWAEIERSTHNLSHVAIEAAVPGTTPTVATEVCWLNRSMRSLADPRSLAEVVADPNVGSVDLPRRLETEIGTSSYTVGAPQYRERRGRTGKGIIVAVIDSEVSLKHPALRNRVIHKQNLTPESWGNPGAHGTAVAGIVASDTEGYLGMAPEATIYNYKVLATNRHQNAEDFDGALAVQHALEDGAHIANCSWGVGSVGSEKSREARALDTAWGLGLTIVKSAGNKGPGVGTLTTPADADGVVVVGATDQAGTAVQDYSSRGPLTNGGSRPHLVAPGGTVSHGLDSSVLGGGFGDVGWGTSYATPHVSGLLALILEGEPNLTPDKQRARLLSLCTPLEGSDDNTQGRGLISLDGLP